MSPEKKRKIAKTMAIITAGSGLSVIISLSSDIPVLKSLHPTWPPMNFVTAIAFVLSGMMLYYIVRAVEGEFSKVQAVLSITSLVIILSMSILLFAAIFKVHTGLEALEHRAGQNTSRTIAPKPASIPEILNFILVGIAGIIILLSPERYSFKLKLLGIIIAAIGLIAILGYSIDVPALYYYIEDINSATACFTAILFVLLGIGLLCL